MKSRQELDKELRRFDKLAKLKVKKPIIENCPNFSTCGFCQGSFGCIEEL